MKVTKDLPNFANELKDLIADDDSLPPVDSWRPEHVGEIDILINRQGEWFYQGEIMQREAIARLFSRILRKEGAQYFLVTPVEKLAIEVEDVPFIVRLMGVDGEGRDQNIHFSTNMGDHFSLDSDHELLFEEDDKGEVIPYVRVRSELFARLASTVYYELADLAVEHTKEQEVFGVWSSEAFFRF